MEIQPVLIDGAWQASTATETFSSENPTTKTALPAKYPVSPTLECDRALEAAAAAAVALRRLPNESIAQFLEHYAELIERHRESLVEQAHLETGLPKSPRLNDVELPRTVNQLREAAAAVREASWCQPTIDTKNNLRSYLAPLGPVAVFGPNNFPFAFNSVAGGDFAAAIAAGNPVVAKANSSHPGTTQRLAELAWQAVQATGLPPATVQLIYRTHHADGERLVADSRIGASAYTGSREAGLKLKAAADAAGKPIYLELSSVNPVVILPGALAERAAEIATEYATSCLMGAGQFCTNPGLLLLPASSAAESFIQLLVEKFAAAPCGTLLSRGVLTSLERGVLQLRTAGAELISRPQPVDVQRYCHANSLLRVSSEKFLHNPHALQAEAFGNAALIVTLADELSLLQAIESLEGNLTGTIYSALNGSDDAQYLRVAETLRPKVGRLLNDKMPTGVAVSAAMNHGGPFPATGHPGFTAVGIPASLRRFAMLQSFDAVRPERLPLILQNTNPGQRAWRWVDGTFTRGNVE